MMLRRILTATLASAAIAVAAPALAAPGGGGGEGHGGGVGGMGVGGGLGGGMGAPGGVGAGLGTAMDHADMNSNLNSNGTFTNPAIGTSQGPAHASATGIAHANSHSVLAGTGTTTRVTSGALSGLTTGTTVMSNGTTVGTVTQIRTMSNGTVVAVVVQGTNGHMYQIPVRDLTFANGTLTTTARLAGINVGTTTNTTFTNPAIGHSQGPMHASATGIAHANSHSVLAGGAVASTMLPGLTTGLTVQNSMGTSLGTVSRIVTDSSGNIRLVYVTTSTGQTIALLPTTLSISGNVVTTTSTSASR